jgi:hypothetical protein
MGQEHETYWSLSFASVYAPVGSEEMGTAEAATSLVQIDGENALVVERLREPVSRALGNRRAFYSVRVETVGRVGEILVSILGHKGRIPLLFAQDELEPGYVHGVVRDTVDRFGF